MVSSMSLSARAVIRSWIISVAINTMCLPTDKIPSRFVGLEPTRATARTVVVCCALLLLRGFAGGSVAQAQAFEQKIATCKGCHVTGTLQSKSMIPNIWGQSVGYVY